MKSRNERWFEAAACNETHPDIFTNPVRYKEAAPLCAACPVAKFCLREAVDLQAAGFAGGLRERERMRLARFVRNDLGFTQMNDQNRSLIAHEVANRQFPDPDNLPYPWITPSSPRNTETEAAA